MNDNFMKEVKRFKTKTAIDNDLKRMLPYGYMEIDVPEIINSDNLERCGFLEKNPDYIQCVLPVKDIEIENVLKTSIAVIN